MDNELYHLSPRPTPKTTIARSTEELNVRYARFCHNNSLNANVPASEQYAYVISEHQSRWLDRHLTQVESARVEGHHFADDRTEIVREIAADLRQKEKKDDETLPALLEIFSVTLQRI
jgi:hypothetical protein